MVAFRLIATSGQISFYTLLLTKPSLKPNADGRRVCLHVISHGCFEALILLMIVISCGGLMLERPSASGAERYVVTLIEFASTAVFLVEVAIKIVGFGLLGHEGAYFSSQMHCIEVWPRAG